MNTPIGFFTPYLQSLFAFSLSLSHRLSDGDKRAVKMAGEMSSFEGRLRKRRGEDRIEEMRLRKRRGEDRIEEMRLRKRQGEDRIEEMRSRQDASRRKNRKKKVHSELYAGFNAERTDFVVLALQVQRREVAHEEANERDDDAVAENQQVEKRETGETAEGEIAAESEDKQDVKESGDTQAVSETILEENQVTGQQVGGVIQGEEHDQENQAEIENQQNHAVDNRVPEVETELPENQYLYVGTDDWPTTWNHEEEMVWGLGLRSSPNLNVEYICGIGWVKKNIIH